MIDVNSPYERHISARLLDSFAVDTPWHRCLWSVGLVLTIREILEASEAVQSGVLSKDLLRGLSQSAMALAGRDPGVGPADRLRVLQEALRTELRFKGIEYRILEQLIRDIEANYLERWAVALCDPNTRPKPERTARAIAGHLLDTGFSSDFLHRWCTYRLLHEPGIRRIGEIVADTHSIACRNPREYVVLVAFAEFSKRQGSMPTGWLDAPAVSQWLRERNFKVQGVRQRGGVLLSVAARDPDAAVSAAKERLEKYRARALVGSGGGFEALPIAWIEGSPHPFRLKHDNRTVGVHALERERQIYADSEYSRVDAAIELLEPLASSSPATAAASAWAAFEALLSEPGDHAVVADRMAAIVACSFPRAELTLLAHRIAKSDTELARRLESCTTNRDRAEVIANELGRAAPIPVRTDSDRAALERMRRVLEEPQTVLKDIEGYAAAAFRRLYRQRNLILHGGKTDAVSLRASLRTSAPLVGAAMDRIAHAWFVERISPLELAARARISLGTVGSGGAPKCIALLAPLS